MSSAQLPLLAVAPSQPSLLLGDCDDKGFAVALLSRDMTWPIEEMPHGDVAGFYLAAPRELRVGGKDLGELPCAVETIICAVCLDLG